MGVLDDLRSARAAFERREWVAAYQALSDVDASQVGPEDCSRLATAAYLLGRHDDCVKAFQRSFQGHLDAGDTLAAVRSAFWLALALMTRGDVAVGAGWVARAQRLLYDGPDDPGDTVERGYLLIHHMFGHVFQSDWASAHSLAEEITGYGRRFADGDLLAMGLTSHGRVLLYLGRVREGLALFDEAMAGIAAGEVTPILAGHVYCTMIEGCQEVSDFGRAGEWTAALTRWCEEQPGLIPFTGQCAVHRGQIMRLRGAWREAVEEFASAVGRYVAAGQRLAGGLAHAERGDVLRLMGDLPGAAAAYDEASALGYEPQPGLALLWMAQGRTAAAVTAIRRVVGEAVDPVHRSRLLPAAVEILLAAGHDDEAAPLADELGTIATAFGCPALEAHAAEAASALRLAAGDPSGALPYLRKAARTWSELEAPYEQARARAQLGRAFRALGDEQSAVTELSAARRSFADLGAGPAAEDAALALNPGAPRGLTAREVEVLRLVASGKSNHEIATALALSEKTVARHLSNIFTKLDVTSRTAAAAFAFEHALL